jgi:hypothetical protein
MRWITNLLLTAPVKPREGETQEQAIANFSKWLEDKLIGEPIPRIGETMESLKEQGLVGVYAR